MKKAISVVLAAAAVCASLSCIPFTADAATIKGDVNGDNRITLRDATLAQRINAGMSASDEQKYSADFNSSGSVELEDAYIIQKFVCLDSTTVNQYAPNRVERIKFLDALNKDRVAAGLKAIEYNDAMFEAGNIRVSEYLQNSDHTRPNGQQYYSVLAKCNLSTTAGVSPLEKEWSNTTYKGATIYESLKSSNSPVYQMMMSDSCKIVCVGSSMVTRRTATWIFLTA